MIETTLIQQDQIHQSVYQTNANHYRTKLTSLKQEFTDFCASLTPEQRRLVTSHDAFTYFGRDCNIQFLAPQGISTEDEPGAQEIAQLIEQIQRETGVIFGGKLYSDALSEQEGAANHYLNLMLYNLQTIHTALMKTQKSQRN